MTRRTDTPPRSAYSVPEVAASLGVSKAHAYRMCASGALPSVRLGERVVVPVAAFDAFVATFPQPQTA